MGRNVFFQNVSRRVCAWAQAIGNFYFPLTPPPNSRIVSKKSNAAADVRGCDRPSKISTFRKPAAPFSGSTGTPGVIRATALVLLLSGCLGTSMWATSASAKPPPSYRRGQIAHFVQDIFDRFFFKTWLGEPISLSGQGACPDAQIRDALQHKENFPEAFRRRNKGPGVSAEYCGVVSIQLDSLNKNMSFVLRVPVSITCAQYRALWETFASEESRSAAVQPYALSDATYEKFSIPEQSRSIYRKLAASSVDQALRFDKQTLNQLRIVEANEQEGFCRFVFSFAESRGRM